MEDQHFRATGTEQEIKLIYFQKTIGGGGGQESVKGADSLVLCQWAVFMCNCTVY